MVTSMSSAVRVNIIGFLKHSFPIITRDDVIFDQKKLMMLEYLTGKDARSLSRCESGTGAILCFQ